VGGGGGGRRLGIGVAEGRGTTRHGAAGAVDRGECEPRRRIGARRRPGLRKREAPAGRGPYLSGGRGSGRPCLDGGERELREDPAHLVTRPRRKAARPAVVLLSATCRAAPRPPLRELLLLELLLLELVARAVPAVESERLDDQPILLGHVIATLALGGAGPLRTRRVRKR